MEILKAAAGAQEQVIKTLKSRSEYLEEANKTLEEKILYLEYRHDNLNRILEHKDQAHSRLKEEMAKLERTMIWQLAIIFALATLIIFMIFKCFLNI